MAMKTRWATFLLFALLFPLALSGCASSQPGNAGDQPDGAESSAGGKLLIYTTIFPLYDFARQIGGEYVTVKSIVPTGAEPHEFEPTARQMAELNQADLFVYNGAGYEAWVERAIENLDPDKVKVVDASEGLPLLAGTHVHDHEANHETAGEEGQAEVAHEEGHPEAVHEAAHEEEHEAEGHAHEGGVDPHVWLDPNLAKAQANHILNALVELDPEHRDAYQANYARLAEEMDALDAAYREAVNKASTRKLVVAHAFLGYLAERYGLEQIPVSGLSPSDEPSQKELMELVEILKENDIRYVAFDVLVESKVAQTVQREAGAEAVTIHSIENVTKEQLEQGITYAQLMRENLDVLKKVLGVK